MKRTYTAPKLTSFGNVTEITQITGSTTKNDFQFLNGTVISGNNDLGSLNDICTGTESNKNCTTAPVN
ncbi:MAG: lasso peptide [Rivularia sp. (in: cyanobacteria)]